MLRSRTFGALLTVVIAACGGGTASPTTQADPSPGSATTRPQDTTDSPPADGSELVGLEMAVRRADDRAVTSVIKADAGGVIEAEGADGTRYMLSIPAGALLADTSITMTPLDSITGNFVDGLAGGVDLAPGGLELRTPATLEILATRPVPLSAQVPFGYEGDDTRLAMGLIQPDPDRLLLWIFGFSGAGVLESTTARMEMNRRLAAADASYRDSVAQRIGDILTEHRAQGGEDLSAVVPQMEIIFNDYVEVLRQRMDYVERRAGAGNPGDLEYFQTVAEDVTGMVRHGELLELDLAGFPAEASAWLGRVMQTVASAMYARCVEEHDFTVIPIILGLARQLALLGQDEVTLAELDPCVAFEMRIESEVEYRADEVLMMTFPTTAQGPVPAAGSQLEPTAIALQYPDAYMYPEYADPEACVIVPIGVGQGTLDASSFAFVWKQGDDEKRVRPDGRWTPPDDVLLLYDLEGPPTTWHFTGNTRYCTADPSYTFEFASQLAEAWDILHSADRTGGDPRWIASDWEMLFDGETVARRTYERTVLFVWCLEEETCLSDIEATERTTFTLLHAPGG